MTIKEGFYLGRIPLVKWSLATGDARTVVSIRPREQTEPLSTYPGLEESVYLEQKVRYTAADADTLQVLEGPTIARFYKEYRDLLPSHIIKEGKFYNLEKEAINRANISTARRFLIRVKIIWEPSS